MKLPLWAVARSAELFNRPDLPLLSMSAAYGLRARPSEGGRAASEDLSGYRVVEPGWLVVNKLSARDGALAVSDLPGIVSPAYWVLQPDQQRVWPRFLHFYLRSASVLAEVRRRSKFMPPAQFDLPWEQFRDLALELPPVQEQRRIADFLNDQVARVDLAQDQLRRQMELIEQRLESFIEASFVRVADGVVPVRRLLRGPASYGLVPTRVLVEGDGPRYVRTTDIGPAGRLRDEDVKAVPLEESAGYLLRSGDVLVSRSGSIGRCYVVPTGSSPAVFAGYLVRLCFADYEPQLFRLFLRTRAFRAQVAAGAVRSTIENFNAERYKDLVVPRVPVSRQKQLAHDLLSAEDSSQLTLDTLNVLLALLEERKRALITACVTGEFDVATASARAAAAVMAGVG